MSPNEPISLKAVDKLNITFLVDNNIEWMTSLPPGFTHELQQHVHQPGHGFYDELKGVPVLDFDKFCCGKSLGAHGFAALIETQFEGEKDSYLTLFDTGPDSQSLVRNIKAMQVPVERIERVVISHWHSDHTGGLLSFLSLRNNAVESSNQAVLDPTCAVDVHPDRPIARGIAPGPTYDKVLCALPQDPTFEAIEALKGTMDRQKYGHTVAGGSVWVSGEIPRQTEFETGLKGGMRWVEEAEDGKWISDSGIMDERYAAIDMAGKGLVIFSACSHAGIVNVVKDALKMFSRPIYMIIGGLHLAGPEYASRIPMTVEFLSETLRPAPTYILPMHCSGFEVKLALEKAFGMGCVPAGVGHRIHLESEREIDVRLLPASYKNT